MKNRAPFKQFWPYIANFPTKEELARDKTTLESIDDF